MTHQEILEKAIQKAIDGGLYQDKPFKLTMKNIVIDTGDELGVLKADNQLVIKMFDEILDVENIIFNHDFAKALWGNDEYYGVRDKYPHSPTQIKTWQYHLQQMVISYDPITYLGEHLNG